MQVDWNDRDGLPGVGEEIAGVPQQFDSGLLLELQSEVGHFIEHGVALLQTGSFRRDVAVMERPVLDTFTIRQIHLS